MAPSKRLLRRQQRLKAASGAAGAGVLAAQLLEQFLVAMDDAVAALHLCFGVESPGGACSASQKQYGASKRSRRMVASCRRASHVTPLSIERARRSPAGPFLIWWSQGESNP